MSAKPTVAAIIPCYNRADYIRETVNSALNQSYPNVEVWVVDDGSTDGSLSILEGYGDRIHLLRHPGGENHGQSASINLALRYSSGEYVAILDSDDVWFPDKIAEQVGYMEAHADVGLVYGNGEGVDAEGRHLYDIYGPEHAEHSDPARLLMDCYLHVPTNAMIRRSVFERLAIAGRMTDICEAGFDESLRSAQDHDFALRVAEVAKIAYVDRKWYQYRRHEGSISAGRAELRWRNGFRVLRAAKERGLHAYPRSVMRGRRATLHFRLAQCLIESRDWLSAGAHLCAAGLLDPLRSLKVIAGQERVTSPH